MRVGVPLQGSHQDIDGIRPPRYGKRDFVYLRFKAATKTSIGSGWCVSTLDGGPDRLQGSHQDIDGISAGSPARYSVSSCFKAATKTSMESGSSPGPTWSGRRRFKAATKTSMESAWGRTRRTAPCTEASRQAPRHRWNQPSRWRPRSAAHPSFKAATKTSMESGGQGRIQRPSGASFKAATKTSMESGSRPASPRSTCGCFKAATKTSMESETHRTTTETKKKTKTTRAVRKSAIRGSVNTTTDATRTSARNHRIY